MHFGLTTSIMQQIGCCVMSGPVGYGLRTHVCYLSLPSGWQNQLPASKTYKTMLAVIDPVTLTLPEAAKKKFNTAIRALQLGPYVHPVQVTYHHNEEFFKDKFGVPCIHQVERDDVKKLLLGAAEEYAASEWPKMINLVREPHTL